MKLVIVAVLAVVALAVAAPQNKAPAEPAKILRSDFDQQPNGAYSYAFETEDKTQHEEQAEVKQSVDEENKPVEILVIRGSYSYVDPDGNTHSVTYVADETGFHPESDDIPKPARR